jgi:hypothetical protein
MWRRIALLAAVVSLLGAGRAWATPLYAPETIAQDFRVEWQVGRNRKGPVIDGYVYNHAMRTADRMPARTSAPRCRPPRAIACSRTPSTGPAAAGSAPAACRPGNQGTRRRRNPSRIS